MRRGSSCANLSKIGGLTADGRPSRPPPPLLTGLGGMALSSNADAETAPPRHSSTAASCRRGWATDARTASAQTGPQTLSRIQPFGSTAIASGLRAVTQSVIAGSASAPTPFHDSATRSRRPLRYAIGPQSVARSPDASRVAVAASAGTVIEWSTSSRKRLRRLDLGGADVNRVIYSGDGRRQWESILAFGFRCRTTERSSSAGTTGSAESKTGSTQDPILRPASCALSAADCQRFIESVATRPRRTGGS